MRDVVLCVLPLLCALGAAQLPAPTIKEFYIAAVEIGWDYIHLDNVDSPEHRGRSKDVPEKYIKAVYREYTDSSYTVPKPRPAWAGIQGPVILTKAGDKVVIHFKNLASQSYSISPVGITYWKQFEGAGYDDSTAGPEKEDDAVPPGGYYKYMWAIKDGPTSSDPECLTYSYSSQVDVVRDLNAGLIGALLVCKPSAFTEDGQRKNVAFTLMFAVFDESMSWYGQARERMGRFRKSVGRSEYHTINGYINSTLPGLTMCQGRKRVFWHLIGIGTAPEIHSIKFQDHTLQVMNHRKVTMEITPMTFTTAALIATTQGHFSISCQIHAHREAGMSAAFTVQDCPKPVMVPGVDLRKVEPDKEYDYNEDYSDEDDIAANTIDNHPNKPTPGLRSTRDHSSKTWVHYIAAEEMTWNYAPHLNATDSKLRSEHFPSSPHRLGFQYKKVVYVEYTDKTFTQKMNRRTTLLGPLLKGQVNDQLHIIFKNLASRPFNIYPDGLTKIYPMQKPASGAVKDLRSMAVRPNGTFGYVWRLTADDEPLQDDPKCLTQLFQSTVDPERDLASGLVGTLLICKHEAIDTRGRLVGPDQENTLMFAVFDENRSWYIGENIEKYFTDPSQINPNDPEFYNSNVIYSVNGVIFNARQFVMCQSEVAFWHVTNVGTQSDFLSVYFTGNSFQYHNVYRSVLTLFPMTGETVPMEVELTGEWEISAFDGSLNSRGMTIRYSVKPCDNHPLFDKEEDDDLSDYIDQIPMSPRGMAPRTRTVVDRLCKDPISDRNATRPLNATDNNVTREVPAGSEPAICENVAVTSSRGDNATTVTDGDIPMHVLEVLERDDNLTATLVQEQNGKEQIAEAEPRIMDGGGIGSSSGNATRAKRTKRSVEAKAEEGSEMANGPNGSQAELEEDNEIRVALKKHVTVNPSSTQGLGPNVELQNHIQSEPKPQMTYPTELDYADYVDDNDTSTLSLEYGDTQEESVSNVSSTTHLNPRSGRIIFRNYFIAAEEVTWDYGIRLPHQLIKPREMRRGMRKFLREYKKVVFRAYTDETFLKPLPSGEQQHLGIMGPFIRCEINNVLTVTFKNKASRPYSFHLQGVYDRSQGAGTVQYQKLAFPLGVPGEPVPPGEARAYNWKVTKKQGPSDTEFDCKAGAYYSTVDKERDLHSGLIGPLLVCKANVFDKKPTIQEYALLFQTFDETKSWYLEDNLKQYCTPPCQANREDPWFQTSNKFAAINGYVAETLPGLLVAQNKDVWWHLLNVGGDGEYHTVHFHGLPLSTHAGAREKEHMAVYNLFPGVFATVKMKPPTVGTWLVECTIGQHQLAGMRARLLVYNPNCVLPLGMASGWIKDSQITASDHIGNWEPRLARLGLSGSVNAWMGSSTMSWLQVDLLRPTLVHRVITQGARSALKDFYIQRYTISYSLDLETWTTYQATNLFYGNFDSARVKKKRSSGSELFDGNFDSNSVKENNLTRPLLARYIRIQPRMFRKYPTLRLELLGCDINSCSFPLGLQSKPVGPRIPNECFTASSFRSSWRNVWTPALARLHQEGSANAWRPQNNNPYEWLQVDLQMMWRITAVVTQGARSLVTQMFVTEFSVAVSVDGRSWSTVMEMGSQDEKIFEGNSDPDEEMLNLFDPPLFGRFIRIHPRGWVNNIALRLEVLGCQMLQRP